MNDIAVTGVSYDNSGDFHPRHITLGNVINAFGDNYWLSEHLKKGPDQHFLMDLLIPVFIREAMTRKKVLGFSQTPTSPILGLNHKIHFYQAKRDLANRSQ